MDKNEAKIRIQKLTDEINRQRFEYHVMDKPEMSLTKRVTDDKLKTIVYNYL
jgi:NAD-dependent DNA ligase